MASVITRAFRLVEICDLDDLGKGSVRVDQLTEISHNLDFDKEELKFEDSVVPNLKIRSALNGEITVKGAIEDFIYKSYVAGIGTKPLFELDHNYLIRFIALSVNNVAKMSYGRWTGQLTRKAQETRTAGEINAEKEIVLDIVNYSNKSFSENVPYKATAGPTPGPANSAAAVDYDPTFMADMVDTTKTLAAAETEVGAEIVNPF